MEVGVQEAAARLGLSVDSVRRRVKAGRLESRRSPDGRILVILSDETPSTDPLARAAHELAAARQELAAAKQEIATLQTRLVDLAKARAVDRALLDAAEREVDYLRSAHTASLVISQRLLPERTEPASQPPWWKFWTRQ